MWIDWSAVSLQVRGVGHVRWPTGRTEPGRWWARWVFDHDLWVVQGGRGAIRLREGWVDLERGRALWLRPGWEYHARQDPDDPLENYFCHFDLLDGEGRVIPPMGFSLPPEDLGRVDMAFAEPLLGRCVASARGESVGGHVFADGHRAYVAALLRGLVIELDAQTAQQAGSRPQPSTELTRVQQLAHRLAQNPAAAPPVAEMAAQMNLSRTHFTRLFKQVCHHSPQRFLMVWRIRHADRLLAETDQPVGDIAARLGYRDVYFFSRQFKQQRSLTPTRFRRAMQDHEGAPA